MGLDRSLLHTLLVVPERNSYTYEKASQITSSRLKGTWTEGRKDIKNSVSIVKAVWILTPFEFEYFIAFFRGVTMGGSMPFLLDLIIDVPGGEEHIVKFVPGSLVTTDPSEFSFVQEATLEVTPN